MDEAISQAQAPLRTEQDWSARLFPNNEWILLIVIAVECLLFTITGNIGTGTAQNTADLVNELAAYCAAAPTTPPTTPPAGGSGATTRCTANGLRLKLISIWPGAANCL